MGRVPARRHRGVRRSDPLTRQEVSDKLKGAPPIDRAPLRTSLSRSYLTSTLPPTSSIAALTSGAEPCSGSTLILNTIARFLVWSVARRTPQEVRA